MTSSLLWPDIDTVDLRLLTDVARTGSIRAAATGLGMSQPSASTRLSALERRLGAVLLDRSPRGATLTPAGDAVNARALRMLELLAAAKSDALHLHGKKRISLGAPASLAAGLAVLLAHAPLPATTVAWRSDHSTAALAAVLDTTLDAAFVTQSHGPSGLTLRHLWDEAITVTVRPDHPLAHNGVLKLADMAQHAVALHLWGDSARDIQGALGERGGLTVVSPATTAVALADAAGHVAITLALATQADVRSGRLVELQVRGLNPERVRVSLAFRTATNDHALIEHLSQLRTSQRAPRHRNASR